MIRISITWFHLDVGMRANVQIFDNKKNEFLAEWNVEVEDPKGNNIRHYPQEPNRHLPPLYEQYHRRVTDIINVYLTGYRHETNVHQWVEPPFTPDPEESRLSALQIEQIYNNHAH